MWPTVFVADGKEHRPSKPFPPLMPDGRVLIYLKDTFSGSNVPVAYQIDRVLFDLYSDLQYVYLKPLEECAV